jgi:hypothetical protein
MLIGGYFIDKETDQTWQPYAITLYAAGGLAGTVGVGFFLTAWFYDMIDTPRAVKSGGKPAPNSLFHKDAAEFDKDR